MLKIERVLLVGLGSIGRRHLGNLKNLLPDAKLFVLRSRAGEGVVDGCEVVTTVDEALDFQPQAAFICNPSSFHIEIATTLAEAGVHVFIEKPLSNKLEGLSSFINVINKSSIKAMVGYNLRFSKSLCALRELIQSQKFGRALCAVAEVGQYLPDWRPDADYRSTVSAQANLGGGVLLELSHELDYLSWLFGDSVRVSGQLLKVSDLEIDVEDLVLAQVCFEKEGVQVNSSIHLDLLQRKPYRSCKVICEKASLIWNAIDDCVEVHQGNEVSVVFQGDKERNYTYEQELLAFISSIENDKPVPISVEEGFRVTKLVEALKMSSETGAVVNL